MFSIQQGSDHLIEIQGPIKRGDAGDEVIISAVAALAYVFNDSDDTTLTADLSGSVSTITVEDSSGYVVGNKIRIMQDDGTFAYGVIATVPSVTTVTISPAVSITAGIGRSVNHQIISSGITLASYPSSIATTAKVGTYDWGFRGTLADTETNKMKLGQRIRIEIQFNAATGFLITETLYATVVRSKGGSA